LGRISRSTLYNTPLRVAKDLPNVSPPFKRPPNNGAAIFLGPKIGRVSGGTHQSSWAFFQPLGHDSLYPHTRGLYSLLYGGHPSSTRAIWRTSFVSGDPPYYGISPHRWERPPRSIQQAYGPLTSRHHGAPPAHNKGRTQRLTKLAHHSVPQSVGGTLNRFPHYHPAARQAPPA